MVGWVRLRGRCKYVHVSSVAACSCALSCAHGKTGVGRPAQPARGMPRAHAAHAPPPDPPRLRQFSAICRNAWPALGGCRAWSTRRSTPCVDALRSIVEIFDFNGDSSTHGVDLPPSPEIRRGWGGVGWQDRWRHGWRHRAPWMGLRRVLPTHTAPANKQNSQSRLLPLPLQVQGRRPCRTNPNPRPGNPRSASARRPWSTRRSTPCVDALRSIVEIFDFNGDSSTHGVDLPPSPEIRRGWGGVGWQDRWRHGWRHRAPWMGLRRVLPTHTAPANKQNSQSRLLPLPLQVQGRRPCRTNPNPRPGNPRSASAHRSARDAACPSASAAPATAHPPAYPAAGPAGCAPGSAGPAAGR